MKELLDKLRFNEQGLIPAIVQQYDTGEVLMMAYQNKEALELTLSTKTTWFWSRSRGELWNKGATSGNIQKLADIRFDCDADCLLLLVDSPGPACHTGERSCFFRPLDAPRPNAQEPSAQTSGSQAQSEEG
ncbi:MAG: phosphoribosyl-AMP cyclohydrolase [Coriobacteriia bacterium]|jgi:phosphoribosyl-AMP cyclohydrolase|nr:phosphoribosyl-AMP cyclohydrolase [Coriobacteriia bacterium]MDR2714312.1 phosphoribosyl-AMP cyclohydrolase [Coriobacteriales bacterium]